MYIYRYTEETWDSDTEPWRLQKWGEGEGEGEGEGRGEGGDVQGTDDAFRKWGMSQAEKPIKVYFFVTAST
jgi:hypothetical protein